MGVLWEYVEKNGRMVDVYTDRDSMFTVAPRPGESKEQQREFLLCPKGTLSLCATMSKDSGALEIGISMFHQSSVTGGAVCLACYDKYLSGLGLRATDGCKPRQVRKEATVVVRFVCRGLPGAWH